MRSIQSHEFTGGADWAITPHLVFEARYTRKRMDDTIEDMSITDNLRIVEMWTGEGEIRLPEVAGEEMHMLAPIRMGPGFRCSMSYSVTDLRALDQGT